MPQPSTMLLDELIRVSGQLDQVIGDLQLRSPIRREPHRDDDAVRDRVELLAEKLRGAVRGPSFRSTAAPIWSNGAGQAAW